MPINWYPGHMVTALRQIKQSLNLVDVVIQVLDARIPKSSQNPDILPIIQNKKTIIILNKIDLADQKETLKWINYFNKNGMHALPVQSESGKGINEVINKIEEIMRDELQLKATKGRIGKAIRVLIVGIPNVGKSSFINRISKKTSAKVGNKPGVTRQNQWIRVNDKIELLDTPGVLWPKFENKKLGLHLSYTGTIKDEILDTTEIAFNLIEELVNNYSEELKKRYKLEDIDIKKLTTIELIDIIANKRGALLPRQEIDYEKISNIIINDFRQGKIGNITLEKVEE